jgi:hypothetical protein
MQSLFLIKDKLLLLFASIVCAILAWSFWAYFKNDAFSILILLFMVCLVIENYTLRKKLKLLSKSPKREIDQENVD